MRVAWYRRKRKCPTKVPPPPPFPRGHSSINPITESDKPFLPPFMWSESCRECCHFHCVTTPSPRVTNRPLRFLNAPLLTFLRAWSSQNKNNVYVFVLLNRIFLTVFCRSHGKSIESWRCPSTVLLPQSWRNETLKAALLSRKIWSDHLRTRSILNSTRTLNQYWKCF